MLNDEFLQHLSSELLNHGWIASGIQRVLPVSGGSVNQTYALQSKGEKVFVKVNSRTLYPHMFEKEQRGLELLRQSTALHVPKTLLQGEFKNWSYLLLECIEEQAPQPNFWEVFGRGIAELHQHRNAQSGLDESNYNGSLPQQNTWESSWVNFFIEHRLQFQEKLAVEQGRLDPQMTRLLAQLYAKLPDRLPEEPASLLHGDLWSGNFMVNHWGQPSIMDPAVYYGHREVDLSMSLLFGGFHQRFYRAYETAFPLEKGWEERVDLYNLYPLLVHVNLFGASYATRVKGILKRFV